MYAWQFAKALYTAELHGWSRFVSMQNHFNLLNREEEREMMPLCRDRGIGIIPWSPLARGRLTRDWNENTERSQHDAFAESLYLATENIDRQIFAAVDRSPRCGTSRVPRSPWLGYYNSPASPHRLSVPQKQDISKTQQRPCRSSCPTTNCCNWNRRICRMRLLAIDDRHLTRALSTEVVHHRCNSPAATKATKGDGGIKF